MNQVIRPEVVPWRNNIRQNTRLWFGMYACLLKIILHLQNLKMVVLTNKKLLLAMTGIGKEAKLHNYILESSYIYSNASELLLLSSLSTLRTAIERNCVPICEDKVIRKTLSSILRDDVTKPRTPLIVIHLSKFKHL